MKLWSIQILRFVAALLVVYFHAANGAFTMARAHGISGMPGANIGWAGVDIFFVISGFVIARTSRGLSSGEFIARRARRILPLYFLFAAFWTLVNVVAGNVVWRDWLATWAFLPVTDRATEPLNPVAWTLCYEALFYAAFALVLWRRLAIVAIAAVFVPLVVFRPHVPILEYIGNPIILEFLAGVALAFAPPWRWAVIALPVGALVLGLDAIYGWAPISSTVDDLLGIGAWLRLATVGVPALLIVWGTLQLRAKRGVLTYLGDASYALYVVHVPVVLLLEWLLIRVAHVPDVLVVVITIIACVLVSWRVHELFEKPLLSLLRRAPRPVLAGA